MNRKRRLLVRLGAIATTIVGLLLAGGPAAAMIPLPDPSGPSDERRLPAPVEPVTDHSNWTLQWVLLAAAVLCGLAIVAAVAGALGRRRWRPPPLEAALGDPDELPRAAGLLGDLFVQQNRTSAAEHAYRAAIDLGDEYWTPIAQVALGRLLSDRGRREEAQALLETAIASGHPRTGSVAQVALNELATGEAGRATDRSLAAYEALGDAPSKRRS